MFHNTKKTGTSLGNVPQVLFVARTTMTKKLTEAGFVFLLHKLMVNVSLVDRCARIRLNVRIFLIRKGIFDSKHALEHLRSHDHSMKHIDATITFTPRCN